MEAGSESDDSLLGDKNELLVHNVRKKKPGIIYLSTLPPFMNVTKIKEIFGHYGAVGRVFLQPALTKTSDSGKKKKKPALHFSEGWVEFERKKIAKEVANTLNNTQIGGKKKSKFYDYIWNIKYLPRFKWAHLSERLAYERAVRKQKLRTVIAQAKRETENYASNLEKSKKSKKIKSDNVNNQFEQRQTENEILAMKSDVRNAKQDRTIFLKSLFASST